MATRFRILVALLAAGAMLAPSCRLRSSLEGSGEIAAADPVGIDLHLPCTGRLPHELVVDAGGGRFSLTELVSSFCRDDPALDPGPGGAAFDTLVGGGRGTWQGVSGAWASFTFADGGGGPLPDYAEITITAPDGTLVLDVAGVVAGDLRARGSRPLPEAPGEDPVDARHSAVVDASGRAWGYRFARLDPARFVEEPRATEEKPGGTPIAPPVIHPDLVERLADGDPDERVLVALNLRDDVEISHFPDLWRSLRCDDPLKLEIDPKVAAEIDLLKAQRLLDAEAFFEDFLGGDHGMELVHSFWLVNGFVADVRLGDVPALAARDDVLFAEPAHLDVPPPMVDGDPGNDILVGRQLMNAVTLSAQPGMDGGCIGLLDTGVHETHVHFTAPPDDNLRTQDTDCDGGGPTCQDAGLPTFHSEDGLNHGTGTASILSGNDVYGPRFRGVTDILVDSWKVYPTGNTPVIGLGYASVLGFQRALESGDRVILAELQLPEPPTGIVATAADNAFDAGAVVVAAAGNCAVTPTCTVPEGTPQPETIRSPANAHKVLGIGAYLLGDLSTPDYQSYGPTEDLRIKPDLQAPTDAEAASQCSPSDGPSLAGPRACTAPATPNLAMLRHGGTSGSAPFAAGAAALVRNRLRKHGTWEPGSTYAHMIMKGDRVHPYDPREGAGRVRLDVCTLSHWGKVVIQPQVQTPGDVPAVEIPIQVASGFDRVEAAIWWPETATGIHNDVDLYLLDGGGSEVAKGVHDHAVFERVEVPSPAAGSWTLKIKSHTFFTPQQIYWALDLVGCGVAIVPDDLPPPMP